MTLGPIVEPWTVRRLAEDAVNFILGMNEDFNTDNEKLYHDMEGSCRAIDQAATSLPFYRQSALHLAKECNAMVFAYQSWHPQFAAKMVEDQLDPTNFAEFGEREVQLVAGGEILRRDLKRVRILMAALSAGESCQFFQNTEHFPSTFHCTLDYLLLPRIFIQRNPSYLSHMRSWLERCIACDKQDLEVAARMTSSVSDTLVHSRPLSSAIIRSNTPELQRTPPSVLSVHTSPSPTTPGQSPQLGEQQSQPPSF